MHIQSYMSILQDLIPDDISSQKCHMNMGSILNGCEASLKFKTMGCDAR
jgi:hypothetical protein